MPLDFALQLPSVLRNNTGIQSQEVVELPNISIKGPETERGSETDKCLCLGRVSVSL